MRNFFQVFNDQCGEDLLQEFYIPVSVEAYDVAIDIIFSENDEDFINFGEIRVENDYSAVFSIRNMGKYPVAFK